MDTQKRGYSSLCLHPVSYLTFQERKHGLSFEFFSNYLPCPWFVCDTEKKCKLTGSCNQHLKYNLAGHDDWHLTNGQPILHRKFQNNKFNRATVCLRETKEQYKQTNKSKKFIH